MMNSKFIERKYLGCIAAIIVMIIVSIYFNAYVGFEGLSISYIRDVSVDFMGILVSFILLIGILAESKEAKRNRAMFRMIFVLAVLFFIDTISSYIEGSADYVLAINIINTAVFIFEDVLGYTFWTYIREESKLKGKFVLIADRICKIILFANIILDILNIKLGIFFTISSTGKYVGGPFQFISDVSIIIIFIVVAVAIFKMSDSNINEKMILMSFEIFPFLAYVNASVSQKYTWVYPANLLSVLLIYIRIFLERGKKIAEQQVVLTKQSTALMISQIQPHFLYNVLTTISNLCVTDPEEAEETTVLFSQYLRTNLDSLRNQDPVPFATELSHIRTYVELEKKRFGDILNVEYDINEQNFKVPSLGLQPIVENSIKHGIRGKNAPGHIKIGTYKVANGYQVIIEDDGIGFDMNAPKKDDGRSHVGMINVKERLKQMCNATVEVTSSPGEGCRTEIIIPE